MQKWIYFTSILTFLNIIGYIIIKSLSSENDIAVACYMSLYCLMLFRKKCDTTCSVYIGTRKSIYFL